MEDLGVTKSTKIRKKGKRTVKENSRDYIDRHKAKIELTIPKTRKKPSLVTKNTTEKNHHQKWKNVSNIQITKTKSIRRK